MRIHIIACRVLSRELSYYAALSPQTVDITWLPQGLHNTPDLLRQMLAETIEDIGRQRERNLLKYAPDCIALGYGLCSNGVLGLQAPGVPLIIPRTDDCIALFLGSQKRYMELFNQYPGTYWINNGWIESGAAPTRERMDAQRAEYVEKYGEDNADFLMEQDLLWAKNYGYCCYIDSPVYQNPSYPDFARNMARGHGWKYERFSGDTRMIQMLCEGTWNEREFLICPPGHRVEADYRGRKMRAVPVEE